MALRRTISIVVPSNPHDGLSLSLYPNANIFCDNNIFVVLLQAADDFALDSFVAQSLLVPKNIDGPQSKISGC